MRGNARCLTFLWVWQVHCRVLRRGQTGSDIILKDHLGCCVRKRLECGLTKQEAGKLVRGLPHLTREMMEARVAEGGVKKSPAFRNICVVMLFARGKARDDLVWTWAAGQMQWPSTEMGKAVGGSRFGGLKKKWECSFGHVNYEMFIRHPIGDFG